MEAQETPHADICEVRCVRGEVVADARTLLRDEGSYVHLASFFASLGDPTRARIVHLLLQQELCTCDIAAIVGISECSVSQHPRVLQSLHLARSRRADKFVYYSLDDAHVTLLVQIGLTHQGHEDHDQVAAPSLTAGGRERRCLPGTITSIA